MSNILKPPLTDPIRQTSSRGRRPPVQSGFGPITSARETLTGVDLSGKVAIATGGYAGIGLETTEALAEAGATDSRFL